MLKYEMEKQNIEKIMNSNLWKRITRNNNFRGYTIIDSKRKPDKKRPTGFFFVLLVFFEKDISENILKRYWKDGAKISTRESLDPYEPYRFYGTIKMLRFS